MSAIDWGKELDRVAEATAPITPGVHTFKLVNTKVKPASTGNQMIIVDAKVEGGPDNGKTAVVNLVFAFDNPKALKMTMRRLSALGITQEVLRAENLSLEQIAGRLIGRVAQGTVTHRMWNGEPQNDVDFMIGTPAGSVPAAPIPTPAKESAPVSIPTPAADDTQSAAPTPSGPQPIPVPVPDDGEADAGDDEF